ncbi:sulfatase-like hydrolase/transferase [Hydrogenophaga sp. 5NK40-0174]|uniref:sulfatase-like hydrolase/transferase n=1 Tax=Hydrogenophaga sp. 5NK40-0174 TaxID=3127649 RepID=UPI00310B971A
MHSPSPLRQLLLELLALALLVAGHLAIQWQLSGYYFTLKDGTIRWLPIVVSTTPALLFYAAARLILPNILSMVLVLAADLVLAVINQQKLGRINEVLSWTDLTETRENIHVVMEFIQPTHFAIVGAALVGLFIAYRLNRRVDNTPGFLIYKLLVIGFLTPLVFNDHLVNAEVLGKNNAYATFLKGADLKYRRSEWFQNSRIQGLVMHVIQTSARTMPRAVSTEELALAEATRKKPMPPVERRKKIVVILCEACWSDKTHFDEAYEPLRKLGFKGMTGVSPSYGGGTANASFEWQTGLPANGVLNGVVYQEYAGVMRKSVDSLAQSLRSDGYQTITAHNYRRKFWHRHEVKPKLGYDKFIGLEDMNLDGYQRKRNTWVDDEFLYKNVYSYIDSNEPVFLYLTTMYTHAPVWHKEGDMGRTDFGTRLEHAVQRVAEFAEYIRQRHDATIIVYADHKPLMTDYFLDSGVFSADMFFQTGKNDEGYLFREDADQKIIGSVPVYVYDKNEATVDAFVKEANGLPFYCQSTLFNKHFVGASVLAQQFALDKGLCQLNAQYNYEAMKQPYPSWLYRMSLFEH